MAKGFWSTIPQPEQKQEFCTRSASDIAADLSGLPRHFIQAVCQYSGNKASADTIAGWIVLEMSKLRGRDLTAAQNSIHIVAKALVEEHAGASAVERRVQLLMSSGQARQQ